MGEQPTGISGAPDLSAYNPANTGQGQSGESTGQTNGQTTGQTTSTSPDGSSPGQNPAWQPMLGKIPPEFHKIIEPDLRQWDENFRTRTQEVQSRYQPYEFLVENEIDPEQINTALQIFAMIETDPRAFHTQMGEFYKDQWGQGQQVNSQEQQPNSDATFSLDGEDGQQFDVTQHPKFKEMAQNQEALATWAAQQIQREQEAEADAEVAAEEERLHKEYGDWPEEIVFALAVQKEIDLEDAVKEYKALENQIRSAPRANDTAPPVFAPSGAVPSSQPKPGQLSDAETRKLVAEMAERAHRQG